MAFSEFSAQQSYMRTDLALEGCMKIARLRAP
jgi:hypothetical protein